MTSTGTYKWSKALGKIVKVSDRVPRLKRVSELSRRMDPRAEIHAGYASLENRGKLNEVHDPEVQADGL